jgi:ferredoxin-thioredoxin reductase catalytic subunit
VTGTEPKTAEAAEFLMRKYINERSLRTAVEKAGKILDAQTEAINKVIDTVIEKGKADGLGILEVRKAMVKELEGGTMTEIENWQAQRIALTEVGAAQNTGTWLEGKGQGLLKQWVHLPVSKVPRSNHIEYGQMPPQEEEYDYMNGGGLRYPHDENADAEEVINCYCDLYWVTKD